MWTLLKVGLAAALLAAFVLLVPFGGLTLADRWRASDGVTDFGRRTWADMQGVPPPARPGGRALARAGQPGHPPGPPPTEEHDAADRRALDRLLQEHLGDRAGR